jgi:hypothetical protein
MKSLHGWSLLVLFLLVLVGCSSPETPTPTDTSPAPEPTTETYPTPDDTETETYPEPDDAQPEAYPEPSGAEVAPYPMSTDISEPTVTPGAFLVPTPSTGEVGVVTGQLLRLEDGETEGMDDAVLYLGGIIQADEGLELVELDKQVAPMAETDALGNFVFTDVPPERYGLMYDTPRGTLLLKNPETSQDMIIEVTGGEVISLGELPYELPEF